MEEYQNKPKPKKNFSKAANQSNSSKHIPKAHNIPSSVGKEETPPPLEGTVAVTDYTVAADLQDLDDKIKSMMMFSENIVEGGKHGRARICKVCGKEGQMANIRDHIEANHITGISHTCNICGKSSRSRVGLRFHVAKYHSDGN